MPDTRQHRGPHPKDPEWFHQQALAKLRPACRDLCWLESRGYARDAALKLVGDHYALVKRQRDAVARCTASHALLDERKARRCSLAELRGQRLSIDGFNCLITIEVALSGGLVLVGLDGAHRDLASVHGTYRRVEETCTAIDQALAVLVEAAPSSIVWFLDKPVSNSGRLAALLRERIALGQWPWQVELVQSADKSVADPTFDVAVSADSWVIDHAARWFDLPGQVIERLPRCWCVAL